MKTPPLKMRDYREALSALEDVSAFLESKEHTSEVTQLMAFTDQVTTLHCQSLQSNSRQLSLPEFFTL